MESFKGWTIDKWTKCLSIFLIALIFSFLLISYLQAITGQNNTISKIIPIFIGMFFLIVISMRLRLSFVWIKRPLIYVFLFMFIVFAMNTLLTSCGFLTTNYDSARYMVSALIQSEAAILAIVITLTLVGVQQTSSSYSPRMADIFKKKNPDLWVLLFVYISSIVYGLLVLKQVEEMGFNYQKHSHIVYIIATFCFVSLIPYMLNTVDLLNPIKVIDLLSEDITEYNLKASILNTYYNRYYSGSRCEACLGSTDIYGYVQDKKGYLSIQKSIIYENDPIQSIIDIVYGSLKTFDSKTAIYGLKIIHDRTFALFPSPIALINSTSLENGDFQVIIEHLMTIYTELTHFTLKIGDEDALLQIIVNVQMIAVFAIPNELSSLETFTRYFEKLQTDVELLNLDEMSSLINQLLSALNEEKNTKYNKAF